MLTRDDFFDEDLQVLFPGVTPDSAQLQNTVNEFFPVDQLSQAEQAELAGLQARAQRLAPIQTPQGVGSSAIPGNPFSTDNSPVINNFLGALTNTFNAIRQRRLTRPGEQGRILQEGAEQVRQRAGQLEENDPRRQQLLSGAERIDQVADQTSPIARLSILQNRAQQAQGQQQARSDVLGELVPSLIERAADVRGRLAENRQAAETEAELKELDFKFDSALLTQRGTQQLVELGKELDNELAAIREKATQDNSAGRSGLVSAGDINNLRQTVGSMVQEINREIELANQTVADPNELEKIQEGLRKQKRDLIGRVFQTAGATAGLPQEDIDDLINQFNAADSTTSGGVSFTDIIGGN